MVSIRAVRAESGKPISGCRVSVHTGFDGSCVRYANSEGIAVFETISPGTYTVYVENTEKSNVQLKGEVVLYV